MTLLRNGTRRRICARSCHFGMPAPPYNNIPERPLGARCVKAKRGRTMISFSCMGAFVTPIVFVTKTLS